MTTQSKRYRFKRRLAMVSIFGLLFHCYSNPIYDALCSPASSLDATLPPPLGSCESQDMDPMLLLVALSGTSANQVPSLQWARVASSGPGQSRAMSVTVDNSGNVYVAGFQIGNTAYDYGNGVLLAGGYVNQNSILLAYDYEGNTRWGSSVVSNQNSTFFEGVTVDGSGIYTAGNQNRDNQTDYGNSVAFTGSCTNGTCVSLVAYNPSGLAQWGRTNTAGTESASFYDVAVSPLNQVVAVGEQSGNETFTYDGQNYQGPEPTNDNGLLVRFDLSGNALGATGPIAKGAGSIDNQFTGVATDSAGNIYVVGFQSDGNPIDYGNGVILNSSGGTSNALFLKYDSNLNPQWGITTSPGSGESVLRDVAVDSSGNIYVVGYQRGQSSYTYGGLSLTGTALNQNAILLKFDPSGNVLWGRTISAGSIRAEFRSVAVDSAGNVYAAGLQQGTESYSYGNGVSASGPSAFPNALLVSYDSQGNALWARTVTAGDRTSAYNGVAVNDFGLYTVGIQNGDGEYTHVDGQSVSGPSSSFDNLVIVRHR